MRLRRKRSGAILIEYLVAAMASILIGIALLALIQTTYSSQTIVMGQNMTFVTARQAVDVLADHIRNAQSYQTSTTPTYAAVSSGSLTSITLYTDSTSGATETYTYDSTHKQLTRTVSSTTTVVLTGLDDLQFTYHTANGTNYTSSGPFNLVSGSGHTPQSTDYPNLVQVDINAEVTINGATKRILSSVRLRNSPYRP